MNLDIRMRHLFLPTEVLAELRYRVTTAFARLAPWVRTVNITVEDVNGPKGGADKQVRLHVRGRAIPRIVIEHVGVDTVAAVAAAVERAVQTLVRKVTRRRGFAPKPRDVEGRARTSRTRTMAGAGGMGPPQRAETA